MSAVPFSAIAASTGMIIWAAVGLLGLIGGMVSVRVARRRNQMAEPAADAPQPAAVDPAAVIPVTEDASATNGDAPVTGDAPLSPDSVIQAA